MAKASGFTCPSCGFDGEMEVTSFIEVDWLVLHCSRCEDTFEYKVEVSTDHEMKTEAPW